MKVYLFILVITVVQATASVYSQTTRLNLKMENATISEVFDAIEKQSDFFFFYNKGQINDQQKVSIDLKDSKIDEVLTTVFGENTVSYEIIGKNIIVKPINISVATSSQQANKKMSGKVTDSTGGSLPGVSVVVKGTTTGVITDSNGNYSLANIPENAILQFSFVGMRMQEILIVNQITVNVVLADETIGLEEVVAIGYGTQKKVNLTGAVSAIEGKLLQNRPVTNATQSLQGLAPGLYVGQGRNAGEPGASYTLNIRGMGNLSGSDSPYVLVDGLEMSLSDVNPNDIENISVLKDAAASSIYGARAAYGVILVTTKKGTSAKATFSYDGNIGILTPLNLPKMVNSVDFAKYFNRAGKNAGGTPQYSDAKIALLDQYIKDPTGMSSWPEISSNTYSAFENSAIGVGNTDYFKLHYKEASIKQTHNISASGGSDAIQYFISGGYYKEDSYMRYADMGYKRFNLGANLVAKVNPWMKLKLNTKYVNSFTKSPFGEGAINKDMFFHNLARFRPTFSAYNLYGNFTELSQIPYLQSGTNTNLEESNLGVLLGMELEPVKNWKVFIDYNFKNNSDLYNATAIPASIVGVNGDIYLGLRSELGVPAKGTYLRRMDNSVYNTINAYSSYNYTLNKNHNFSVLFGYQQDQFRFENLQTLAKDLITFNQPGINLATGDKVATESRYHWATQGYFGRFNYDYNGKYLFEINGRIDGSSRFAPDNRWGTFPSVSVGYNLAREDFMANLSKEINTLKIRGSYGYLGNQSGAAYYTYAQTLNTTVQGLWYFQNGRDMVINAPNSFNSNTTWEKIENLDLGLDFALLNNRLSGTFEVYERNTRDMLGPTADYADMYGATAPNTNNANLQNWGWEFSLNWKGKIGKDIQYSVGGFISDYTTTVLAYENPTKTGPATNWYPGKKVGEIWGYRASGLIQTQAEADEYNTTYNLSYLTGQKWKPGDVKFLDLNGDKKINRGTNVIGDMGDMEIIGNDAPRFIYTFNGMIKYKDLTLSMMWQGVGHRDWAPSGAYFWGSGAYAQVTVFKQHLDYWRGADDPDPNPNAYYPNPYTSAGGTIASFQAKTQTISDRYLQNAAYIRLKNLTVNYDLPVRLISKCKLSKVSLFFSGENLLTFTPLMKMLDPEQVFAFQEGSKNYPLSTVYSFGLNVKF